MKKLLDTTFFNHLISTASLVFVLFAAPLLHAEPQLLDKVVAVVDQNVILQSEVNERIQQVIAQASANQMGLPDAEVLYDQVLDHLITEKLQLQVASRYNLQVTDQEINAAVDQIRQSNRLTPAQFEAQMRRDGMTMLKLKETVRNDITLRQLQQGMMQQRIYISPLEIDNFLKSADAQFWVSPEYRLGHILIALPQSPDADTVNAAKAKAESIVERLNKGAAFADMAIAESKGPAALNGGDLGFRKTSQLPSLFAEIVPNLEEGQVSAPARSGAGFHILKLYEKKGQQTQVQRQSKVRHILVKPSAILSNEEAEAKLRGIRAEALNGTDFAELAKEHSEDIGSMLAGGDLGWSRPGMFVPAFEKAMTATDTGSISEPFRSRFGWHILQVQERRDEDITEEILRNKAANILTNRRFEDELQIWTRELRDNAFIDKKERETSEAESNEANAS